MKGLILCHSRIHELYAFCNKILDTNYMQRADKVLFLQIDDIENRHSADIVTNIRFIPNLLSRRNSIFVNVAIFVGGGGFFTPPRNRGGVIFSLQFVCVSVCLCVCQMFSYEQSSSRTNLPIQYFFNFKYATYRTSIFACPETRDLLISHMTPRP